ncbi:MULTISPECIES: potassium channel family protein [unclassified Blastococcus]
MAAPPRDAPDPVRDLPAPGRRTLAAAVGRTLLTTLGVLVLYAVLPLSGPFGVATWLLLGAGLAGMGLLATWQVRAILHSPHPALRAMEAAALSIPLFLVLFAAAYVVLASGDEAAFTEPLDRVDGLYFVVTVFATVGFGDIAPVSTTARVLTTVQMVGNLVLVGLVLRAFLGAVDRGRRRAEQESAGRD